MTPMFCCNFGCVMGAIDIAKFLPVDQFKAGVDEVLAMVKSSRPAEGSAGVMIPGERSSAEAEKSRKEGVPLSDAVAEEFGNLGRRFRIRWGS